MKKDKIYTDLLFDLYEGYLITWESITRFVGLSPVELREYLDKEDIPEHIINSLKEMREVVKNNKAYGLEPLEYQKKLQIELKEKFKSMKIYYV